MPACKGDLVNCGKYIKQVEAQPWELAVVFIMMAAAVIFVIHFVFFTGGSSDAKPQKKEEQKPEPQVVAKPVPAPQPKKEYADKAVQAAREEDQVFMARQTISATRSRSSSINKSRENSPRTCLSPVALRSKGTSSAFNKILSVSKGRRTITRK